MKQAIDLTDPEIRKKLESPGNRMYIKYPTKSCANCGQTIFLMPGNYWQLQIFKCNKQADLNKLTKNDAVLAAPICEQCVKLIPETACSERISIPGHFCVSIANEDNQGRFKTIFVLPKAAKEALPRVMREIDP